MKLPKPRNENDANVLKHIRETGVFIQSVFGGSEPEFSYSLGLTHNFQNPEIFISGLTHEIRVFMINEICRKLSQGSPPLEGGERVSDLLVGHDCLAVRVEPKAAHDHVFYAQWLHGTKDVPIIQIIWPSTKGIWPWDLEAPKDLIDGQKILAEIGDLQQQ